MKGRNDLRREVAAARRLAVIVLALIAMAGCAAHPAAPSGTVHGPEAGPSPAATPQSAADAGARAVRAEQEGDLDRALYHYIEALSLDPRNADFLKEIGSIHLRRGNQDLALMAFREALEREPEDVVASEGAGLALFRSGRPDAAEPLLFAAATGDPSRWRALEALGVIADLRQDPETAAMHYAAALQIHTDSARLHNNRGYSRYLVGDLEAAAVDFRRALELDPQFERAWRNLALVRARQGRYQEALDLLRRVSPEPQAFNDTGYLAMLNGDYGVAEQYLEEAATRSPTFHRLAHENLGRLQEMRMHAEIPAQP